jgi:murein DD-endopeptidase MepM/ murein hydrolase activator NlpD
MIVSRWILIAAVGALTAALVDVTSGVAGAPMLAAPGVWRWPLAPPVSVVRGFEPPAQRWLPGSRGVDLAGYDGEKVHAAGAGVVTFAGRIAHVGVVSVTTGVLRTTYEPLDVAVHRGQAVRAGDVLGRLSATGSQCAPKTCLHWGLLRGSAYLDPLALLGLEQVRLLPLTGPGQSF